MPDHIVSAFDADLGDATSALVRDHAGLARGVIADDPRLDDLQRLIEERGILTIARRQPLAVDLREVIAALRIASDLERAGDLAKNVAKRVIATTGQSQPKSAVMGIQRMSDLALAQLHDVLDAYAANDVEGALAVWRRDGAIDAMNNSLFRELLTYMMEDPRSISFCTHLLFCAKNIERIGDHTTNIAETIHYLVKGEPLAAERPKDDRASFAIIEPPAADGRK